MTHWRPKGWEGPYRFVRTPSFLDLARAQLTDEVRFYQNEAFEAGADAMLQALRSNQWCPYDLSVLKANYKGKVVIVPDDEKEKP